MPASQSHLGKMQSEFLAEIDRAESDLAAGYEERLEINHDLDRTMVSFQANRKERFYRWFKYREGFSSQLVEYVLRRTGTKEGRVLDPFAGAGTALYVAADRGLDASGIELLPSSIEAIAVRSIVRNADPTGLADELRRFADARPWELPGPTEELTHLRITAGAYPRETEQALGRYTFEANRHSSSDIARVLRLVAMCILEDVSYTRKDGQYLRWDSRSGRRVGKKPFHKTEIRGFTQAVDEKLREIVGDLAIGDLFDDLQGERTGVVDLLPGSCLDVLPALDAEIFDALITSPPYCNRYDYTRTYALELAYLGLGEGRMKALRQTMLSCTVENREKEGLEGQFSSETFNGATAAFDSHKYLRLVLEYLEECRRAKIINNTGIPRMVRNYFFELALVVFEAARVLKSGAPFIMVNDNVRYQGAHIPVDLILSDFALQAGFDVEQLWVLPVGKGNSSQQMGTYGRRELRKGVYVWRR